MTTSPTQLLRLKQEINQIKKLITCPICLDLLENPVSILCDHVYCSGCLKEALSHRNACPLCGQKVLKASIQSVHGISDIITAFDQFIKTAEALEDNKKPSSSLIPPNSGTSELSPVLSLIPINPISDWREEEDRPTSRAPSPLPVDTSVATVVLDTDKHEVGSLVNVLPRTWAGINKLGGVGRVEQCTEVEDCLLYSVRYVLDGTRDDDVPSAFIEKYVELGRSNRRRSSNTFSSPVTESTHDSSSSKRARAMSKQEKMLWSPTPDPPNATTSAASASTSASSTHRQHAPSTSVSSASEEAPLKVVLCTTGIDSKYNIDQKLDKLLECGDVTLSCGFTSDVTHLLVSTASRNNVMQQRTMKYMQALAKGIWIVSTKWLEDCLAANTLLPEAEYEVRGNIKAYVEHAPRRARLAQQNQISLPLVDYKVFLCDPFPLPGPAKSDLEYLVTGCGGSVLSGKEMKDSVKNAQDLDKHVIVCSSGDVVTKDLVLQSVPPELSHVAIATAAWVLDCVTNYSYVPIKNYPLV
eukprot:gene33534-40569_t